MLSPGYCGLLLQLLRSCPDPTDTRNRVLASGALNALMRILNHRPPDKVWIMPDTSLDGNNLRAPFFL